ncbi:MULTISPECIES: glucose PTS transporter subunit IIA [unclassified Corynebacterium]|uniref:glucose PTS transporter subunit IIA n=1 Tax=unclassified Corynebacterium TaxID=2624378 RepID=UPI0029CA26DB|nr:MULTISPECIES: glucose PTS transporter subunit IIA [unclassified Corynebacterium]WPF67031.1 glucose PTS transporter subunit IIA [Corynebacterium sp. 22KM0430]WPF69519.1 glucose PTS transporter subunit IIA [Corynebacterium sp. 21KM1197]
MHTKDHSGADFPPLLAPLSGTIIPMSQVPDPVFAKGNLGEGFGITDTPGGVVYAPVSGTITMIAKTKHALGIRTPEGLEVLIHLGIDTVELGGDPFEIQVTKGQEITRGEALGSMDAAAITEAGKSTCTIVAVTNSAAATSGVRVRTGAARAAEEVAQPLSSAAARPADPAVKPATDPAPQGPEAQGAEALVAAVGGAENIRSVTHCITRLRFYLHNNDVPQDDAVRELSGVIDVIRAGGQYQIVIGPGVEDVYEEVIGVLGDRAAGGEVAVGAGEEQPRPTTALGWIGRGFSSLIGVITGSMIPVIGLLAASGIIKGILSLLTTFDLVTTTSDTYLLINALSDAVFFFLPIFVGFTAAKRLGADPIIVAIVGGVLTYPQIVELSGKEGSSSILGMSLNADFFGLPYHMASYSYSIFPIIVAAWLASLIEPWLKKMIPATVRMIFLPLVEVVVVSLTILLILGPAVTFLSTGIANGIQGLYDLSPSISGLFIGGLYQTLVIFGLHWAVIPLVAQDIALTGQSPLNAIISATMVAQGGAVLAVFVKSRVMKVKELSGSAAIAAFCGITEPAMYGVNLKYGRIFLMASIGGACGGLLTGLFNVNMWGFTGSLIGFTSFINPEGLDFSFWGFWIASGTAAAVAFVLTYLFGFNDSDVENAREVKKIRLGRREPVQR